MYWTIFFVFFGLAYIITGKMFLSLFLGGVVTGVIAAVLYGVQSAVTAIQYRNHTGKSVGKILLWGGAAVLAIVIFLVSIFSNAGFSSPRCRECGKKGIYSEYGYCYGCYKEIENGYRD